MAGRLQIRQNVYQLMIERNFDKLMHRVVFFCHFILYILYYGRKIV